MIKVAAIQMISGVEIKKNLKKMEQLVESAAKDDCKLILLPEFFALLTNQVTENVNYSEIAYELNENYLTSSKAAPVQSMISKVAKNNNVWIVGGTVPLKTRDPSKIYNSMLVFNNEGCLVNRYDKVHLFKYSSNSDVYDETKFISPGSKLSHIKTPVGNTFLSVCYDIRFPEFFRNKKNNHQLIDLILVSAAFTFGTGMDHWEILLRARAIENQCYVLASAQGGKHECGRETWGHSMLISPWGDIINKTKFGNAIVSGYVDHELIRSIRNKLPAIFHQRYDLHE